jgi:hypothetical protein
MYRPLSKPRARGIAVLATLLAAGVVAAACSRDNVARQSASSESSARPLEGPVKDARAGFAGVEAKRVAATDMASVASPAPASPLQQPAPRMTDSVIASMIIRHGNVSIQVDSLEIAMSTVRAMATRLGGYVGNVTTSTGEFSVRTSVIEVKVPSARFDEAMSTLTPLGKVEQSNATAEDVGEEYVDMAARMANARRLEDRLVSLLATRTGKLQDVLTVERELARVREEVERYEGRLRFLRSRAAMSTLAVTLHEAIPLVNPNPGTNVIGEAVKDMWRNFVMFVAAVISSLGVLVPIAAIAGLVALGWRRLNRPPPAKA